MQLYDHPFSPYAFKVRVALYEKAQPFEPCEIRSHDQREALLRLNPRAEVPVLVDGSHVVLDSTLICAYLEERFPTPRLLPEDAAARARCRYLELKSDTEIDACLYVLSVYSVARPTLAAEQPQPLARATALLASHYDFLAHELGDQDWFCGEFSLADIALAPHLSAAAFFGQLPTQHPTLLAWLKRLRRRASIRRALREMNEGLEDTRARSDGFFTFEHLHWRSDRLECAIRCGLGPWLLDELGSGRGFLSPPPGPQPTAADAAQDSEFRPATLADVPAVQRLIEQSARELSRNDYSESQITAALRSAWGVDTQLIHDQSYFVAERAGVMVACGGWSFRGTLFGSDAHADRQAQPLDPARDAARIRAFFVHPVWARRGLGRALLERCERELRARGFGSAQLVATLPGVPLYQACGYLAEAAQSYPLPDGQSIVFVPMHKRFG